MTVDKLIHRIEVFLRENPEWADASVHFEHDRIYCSKEVAYTTYPSFTTKIIYRRGDDEQDI